MDKVDKISDLNEKIKYVQGFLDDTIKKKKYDNFQEFSSYGKQK
jgi:hypothetical protein